MDPNSPLSIAISVTCFVGIFFVLGVLAFWFYGLTPIIHWYLKSNSEPAKAVILEIKDAGWGWYAGGRYSETLVFQPVRVKLEVHPSNGAPYVAKDRFNAKRVYYRNLKPGVEMQVAIARSNPQWVASLPETAVDVQEQKHSEQVLQGQKLIRNQMGSTKDPKAQLEKLKQMMDSGLITKDDYDEKKAEILEDM